ncbi:hypothetical protein CR513_51336, partial [Mucuna pruriens]
MLRDGLITLSKSILLVFGVRVSKKVAGHIALCLNSSVRATSSLKIASSGFIVVGMVRTFSLTEKGNLTFPFSRPKHLLPLSVWRGHAWSHEKKSFLPNSLIALCCLIYSPQD